MSDVLERAKALTANATHGPWRWFGNTRMYEVYLATVDRGRIIVMDFARWGFGDAQPRFQVTVDGGSGSGVMRSLADLAGGDARAKEKGLDLPVLGPLFEVDYRRQFVGIGHPDATFIAESRQLVDDLVAEVERLRAEVERLRAEVERLRAELARTGCTGVLYHDEFTPCPVHDAEAR